MVVPEVFKKKGKAGPARVCDECRFQVKNGATLSQTEKAPDKEEKKPFADEPTPAVSAAAATVLHTLTVKWQGEQKALSRFNLKSSATLKKINRKLLKACPTVTPGTFKFVVNGEPVHEAHYEYFNVEDLTPNLIIRKEKKTSMRASAMMMPNLTSGLKVNVANNPYKSDPSKAGVKAEVKVAKKAPPKFKAVKAKGFTKGKLEKKTKAIPKADASSAPPGWTPVERKERKKKDESKSKPSSVVAPAAGCKPEDVFAYRAKKVFGAK
jgi:hypothetical protein